VEGVSSGQDMGCCCINDVLGRVRPLMTNHTGTCVPHQWHGLSDPVAGSCHVQPKLLGLARS
jgi:hypothetical protein